MSTPPEMHHLHWVFPNVQGCPQHSSSAHSFIHSFTPGTFSFYVLYVGRPKDIETDERRAVMSRVCVHMHTRARTQGEKGCARVRHGAICIVPEMYTQS